MNTLNLDHIKTRLRDAAREKSLLQISKAANVDYASLWRFLNKDGYGVSAKTLEKLWPVLYGKDGSDL